jgi:hypothetical protein
MAILEFFPEPLNQLRQEIDYHPDLLVLLSVQQDKDVYIQISEIAAYCDIVLDGTYTREDIVELCELCVRKLQSKRTIMVLPLAGPAH